MPRNSHIVRRSVRSACDDRSRRPLRLPLRPATMLIVGILVALVFCDMASACGWYRVRRGCVSPCVVVTCCPRVYCYDPCASSYCESWSVSYDSGCGVVSGYDMSTAGGDSSVQMTPTLAKPHAAQRPPVPEIPAPELKSNEAASPTDLPSVVDPPVTPPAPVQPPVEPASGTDLGAPPNAVVPATPNLPATPAAPATEPAPAAPAAVEQPSNPAPVETIPDAAPATTPPARGARDGT